MEERTGVIGFLGALSPFGCCVVAVIVAPIILLILVITGVI